MRPLPNFDHSRSVARRGKKSMTRSGKSGWNFHAENVPRAKWGFQFALMDQIRERESVEGERRPARLEPKEARKPGGHLRWARLVIESDGDGWAGWMAKGEGQKGRHRKRVRCREERTGGRERGDGVEGECRDANEHSICGC